MAIELNTIDGTYRRYKTNQERYDTRTFTYSDVCDVVTLIKNNRWPDSQFGDDECNLWSMIVRELEIEI